MASNKKLLTDGPLSGPPPVGDVCDPVLIIGFEPWTTESLREVLQNDLVYARTSTFLPFLDNKIVKLGILHDLDGKSLVELTKACGGSVIVNYGDIYNDDGEIEAGALEPWSSQNYQAVIVPDYSLLTETEMQKFIHAQYCKKIPIVVMAIEGLFDLGAIRTVFNVSWRLAAYTARSIKFTQVGERIIGRNAFPFANKYTKAHYVVGDGHELFVEHIDPRDYEIPDEDVADDSSYEADPIPQPGPGSPVITSLDAENKCISYFGFVNDLDVSYGAIMLRLCYAPYHNDSNNVVPLTPLVTARPDQSRPTSTKTSPSTATQPMGVSPSPPVKDPTMGFLAFLGCFFMAIGFNVVLLLGTVWHPQTVGLCIVVPYYMYTLFISQPELMDGARWDWFSKNFVIFKEIRRFLNIRLVIHDMLQKAEAEPGAQFIFAVFPHGCNSDFRIAMDGLLLNTMPNVGPSLRVLGATVLFRIPLVRELALWTGCVDARRSVADRLLKCKRSILVLPGGQAEQIRTVHGRETVYLKKRKGFVKLAMQHNVPLVPVYVFGASDYYKTASWAHDFRFWLVKALGIAIPLAWGMHGLPICPFPVPTTIVFGEPLHFQNQVDLDTAHEQFTKALQELFDTHKSALGYGDRTLEID